MQMCDMQVSQVIQMLYNTLEPAGEQPGIHQHSHLVAAAVPLGVFFPDTVYLF